MKTIHHYILPLLLAILAGCSGDEPAPGPEPAPGSPRTLLVYMIANNNLGYPYEWAQYDLRDIAEMEQAAAAGALGDSRLIVFRHAYIAPGKSEMKLLEVTRSGTRELLAYSGLPSSASEETMKRVIADTKAIAPADSYGLVLWSHASGWLNTGIDTPAAAPLSFGYDGSASNAMSVTSLASVLGGEGFDYIYFDCCFMACAEVAYELRHAATWMVASAAELPVNGTPYHIALPYLMPRQADPAAAAKATYTYYSDRYDPSADFNDNPDAFGCTFSAIYLPAMDRLAQSVREIYSAGTATGLTSAIQQFAPQTGARLYCDLEATAAAIGGAAGQEPAVCTEFADALHEAVAGQWATPGIHLQNTFTVNTHCGLTTYLPTAASGFSRENYRLLAWYNDVACNLKL